MRDMLKAHPHYEQTAEFVSLYDNPAFDFAGEIFPISIFEPMLRRVMAVPKNSIYKPAVDAQSGG